MKKNKFVELWDNLTAEWFENTVIKVDGKVVPVRDLCSIRKNYAGRVHKNYELIKKVVKDSYFKNVDGDNLETCRLSRYKRAAVLTYAIIKSTPLVYKNEPKSLWIDPNFLKQRLAFYVAISSIIQDANGESILESEKKGESIFDFSSLGYSFNCAECQDDSFLMSVYKDLLYSEIYDNFNVLTMANLYGLLTEKTSSLKFNN